jgi:PhnB protein
LGEARIEVGVAPWLAVRDGARAVAYYREALGALEEYRLDGDDGRVIVVRLTIGGAAFWLQEDPENSPRPGGPVPVRLVLTVDDPAAWFARAVAAGATEVAPVHEAHGWRTGRVRDPFGHDWEFSRPVGP